MGLPIKMIKEYLKITNKDEKIFSNWKPYKSLIVAQITQLLAKKIILMELMIKKN